MPVLDGRMPHADDGDEQCPHEPAVPCEYAEEHEDGYHTNGKNPVPRPYERVDYVPSVELAYGEEVHGRYEKPYPAGERDRVEHDIVSLRHGPNDEIRKRVEDYGRAEAQRPLGRRLWDDGG